MEDYIEIQVAKQVDSIEQIRSFWESVQCHPNSDIDSYLINVKSLRNVLTPYVMQVLVDRAPKAILIGRIEESRVEYKIGFKTLRGQRLRQLVIVYQGFLGDMSTEVAECLIADIKRSLAHGEIDAVFFYALKVESTLYKAANAAGNILTRDHGTKMGMHWKTPLPPAGIDIFLQALSSKHRYWVRRLPRVLEKDFPGKVVYRRYTDIVDVGQMSIDCELVASQTYHRAADVGFRDNDLWREKFQLWAKKGTLQGHVLYIDGKPCAFWLANLYGETLHLDFTGYLSDYKKYELGTILFLKMIEDAIAAGASELDYGLGALWYKERFGGESWAEASLYFFAPTLKGVTTNLTRWAFNAVAAVSKRILNNLGFTRVLMNRWRDRLSSRSAVGTK